MNGIETSQRKQTKLTFLNITKGSSILDKTLRVIFGGLPSVKAYLSVMIRPLFAVHSPTLVKEKLKEFYLNLILCLYLLHFLCLKLHQV